jgi:hypothetical protein
VAAASPFHPNDARTELPCLRSRAA